MQFICHTRAFLSETGVKGGRIIEWAGHCNLTDVLLQYCSNTPLLKEAN